MDNKQFKYLPPDKRKKILLICDDIRVHSGVATVAKEIVIHTAQHFNWVQMAGAIKHPEIGKKLDISADTNKFSSLTHSSVILYPSGTSKGCKVTVVSKSSSGKRSMSEYAVIDNGTDIFHNEYASLNTSDDQYTAAFDFTASTEPRITLTLTNDHATSDVINFTVLVQEIK